MERKAMGVGRQEEEQSVVTRETPCITLCNPVVRKISSFNPFLFFCHTFTFNY
jgi:hypothetical protein